MRKTIRRRTHKNHKKRISRRVKQSKRVRGGSITTPMVGSLEGEDHKGLDKIVVAGPMGVMSGTAYLQTMSKLDEQGQE